MSKITPRRGITLQNVIHCWGLSFFRHETLLLFRYQVSTLIWKSIFPRPHGNRWVSRRRRGERVDTAPRPPRPPSPPAFTIAHSHSHTLTPLTPYTTHNRQTLTSIFTFLNMLKCATNSNAPISINDYQLYNKLKWCKGENMPLWSCFFYSLSNLGWVCFYEWTKPVRNVMRLVYKISVFLNRLKVRNVKMIYDHSCVTM